MDWFKKRKRISVPVVSQFLDMMGRNNTTTKTPQYCCFAEPVFLCCLGCPQPCDSPASLSQVLRFLQAWTINLKKIILIGNKFAYF